MSTRPQIVNEPGMMLEQSLDSLSTETGIVIPERINNHESDIATQPEILTVSRPITTPPFSGELSTRGLASARKMRSAHSLDEGRRTATRKRLARLNKSSALVEQLQARKDKAISAKHPVHGVFKNSYFKYRGGLISKLLTFFANLLKFIELLVLRLLSGPKNEITVLIKPNPKGEDLASTQKIIDKKKKKLRLF